jgi:DNA-binding MarR family transcriptional regulator
MHLAKCCLHGGIFILRTARAGDIATQAITTHAQIGLLLAAVRRRQRQAVESRVASLRLSSQQFWVLEALAHLGKCSFGKLLVGLPLDQPTASRVLAELRSRDLVDVTMDSDDRRRRQLSLTTNGTHMAQQCGTIAKQVRKALNASFSESELANLATFLERILRNFDDLDVSSPPGQALLMDKHVAQAPTNPFSRAGAFARSNRRSYG